MHASIRLQASAAVWLFLISITARSACAWGMEGFGPAGEHISRSGDWPQGVEEVLRHPSRVYWNWVNGNENGYYHGDIAAINELLELFSKIDIREHQVIVRPGSPSARSFDGKLTPYVVEFEVPSGIYLRHAQTKATTGLYSAIPRLIVHLDENLAEHVGDIKVPNNVSLHELAYRVEDGLAQLNLSDSSVRGRAIAALGEAGDSSPAIIDALKKIITDEDEYARNAAKIALERIEAASTPVVRSLRERVAKFVSNHPQKSKIPDADELLEALRNVDAQLAKGFTAKGTMYRPAPSGSGLLLAWTVTMGDNRLVIEERAIEDESQASTTGRFESTLYVGPEFMALATRDRVWIDGRLRETAPLTRFEQPGRTYDLVIGRMLWPLGLGFGRDIDRISDASVSADGMLLVKSEGRMRHWELRVDPGANHLVRSAKAFRRPQAEPSYIAESAGVMTSDDLSTAHTGRWIEDLSAHPISIAVTSVSATADLELIRRVEGWLKEQPDRFPRLDRRRPN